MTFRGNLLFGVKRLGLFLAFCLALGLIWAEAKPSAQMAVFQSGTNYDIKYPLGWKVFEGSNKGPDWLDESLAEQGDPQKSGAPRSVSLEAGASPARPIVRSGVSEEDGRSRKA